MSAAANLKVECGQYRAVVAWREGEGFEVELKCWDENSLVPSPFRTDDPTTVRKLAKALNQMADFAEASI